jgi:fused signal recognition particle receptor
MCNVSKTAHRIVRRKSYPGKELRRMVPHHANGQESGCPAGGHDKLLANHAPPAVHGTKLLCLRIGQSPDGSPLQYALEARSSMFGSESKGEREKAPGGFLKRLRARLNRGNSWLTLDIAELVRGRAIDATILDELETRLLSADVGVDATQYILDSLRQRVARKELADVDALVAALRATVAEILEPCARPLVIDAMHQPFVILVVGVNGSGKTTSIGKLARRLTDEGKSVMLAAADTFRSAAVEQLEIWAKASNAAFASQQAGADPGAVVFDAWQSARARGIDVLLADTAGRLHSQSHLMAELKKVRRVLQRIDASAPHEVLLVLDANQGQNALAQAVQFHEAVGVTGLVLTKLDGTAKGGIVIAIARKLKLPIRFIGIGEQADDFGQFDAQVFAAALIESGTLSGAAS